MLKNYAVRKRIRTYENVWSPLNAYVESIIPSGLDKSLENLNKEYAIMQNDEIREILPTQITESTDVAFLRTVREYLDGLVQAAKDKNIAEHITEYRPMYEGKFILTLGKIYTKASFVNNPNDITIAKIHSVDYVLHGALKCHATIFNIKYKDDDSHIATGLNTTNFDSVSIRAYNHTGYSVDLVDKPIFLTQEQVQTYVDDATKRCRFNGRWFLEETGIWEKTV